MYRTRIPIKMSYGITKLYDIGIYFAHRLACCRWTLSTAHLASANVDVFLRSKTEVQRFLKGQNAPAKCESILLTKKKKNENGEGQTKCFVLYITY